MKPIRLMYVHNVLTSSLDSIDGKFKFLKCLFLNLFNIYLMDIYLQIFIGKIPILLFVSRS